MERTLILLKPDAVQRQIVGRILSRFEDKGVKIVAMKMLQVSDELASQMYAEHEGKGFYAPLMAFITAAPVVAVVLEGVGAIAIVRKLIGQTFGPDADPGTIRGDFGASRRYNLIHGSDSQASAEREIPLFFKPEELLDYDVLTAGWVYARQGDELI